MSIMLNSNERHSNHNKYGSVTVKSEINEPRRSLRHISNDDRKNKPAININQQTSKSSPYFRPYSPAISSLSAVPSSKRSLTKSPIRSRRDDVEQEEDEDDSDKINAWQVSERHCIIHDMCEER